MNAKRRRLHPAQRHIDIRSGRALGQIDDDKELRRRERPLGRARHAGRIRDDAGARAAEAAHHFAVRTRSEHDGGVRGPRYRHRLAESGGDRKHADEHGDHPGDAKNRRSHRAPPLWDAEQPELGHRDNL